MIPNSQQNQLVQGYYNSIQPTQPRYNPYGATPYIPQQPIVSNQYQQPSYSQPQQRSDIKWVQGIEGAKAHVMPPNSMELLMDSDCNKFYIKQTDSSGRPMPLRSFRFIEETEEVDQNSKGASQGPDMSKYVTKDDLTKILNDYLESNQKKEAK